MAATIDTSGIITFDGIKGYKTYKGAAKKLHDVLGPNPWIDHKLNVFVATRLEDDGAVRFFPVVVYSDRRNTQWCPGSLAHAGLFVTN